MKNNNINTADFWQGRYEEGSTTWDMGQISPALKDYFDNQLLSVDKSINILIAGAGNAYEAEYLHNQGFSNVYVVDFAQTPLKNLSVKVPNFPKAHLIEADFFALHTEAFNFSNFFDIAIEQTFFCAITPDLRAKYVEQMDKLLKDKGEIVGLLWNFYFPHEQSTPPESKPPFGGNLDEYRALFSDKFDITMSPCNNSHPARQGREVFIEFEKKGF